MKKVNLSFPLADGSTYSLRQVLAAEVMEEKYEPNVRPMKIEFVLKKKMRGLKWPNLGDDPVIEILAATGDKVVEPTSTEQGKESKEGNSNIPPESIAAAKTMPTTSTSSR